MSEKHQIDDELRDREAAYLARKPVLTLENRSEIWKTVNPNVEVRGGKPKFTSK